MNPINGFNGAYRFLSNFHPTPIEVDGKIYPTVEHAFQAAKTTNPEEKERVRLAETPGKAKRLGKKVTLVPGWNVVRVQVMEVLLRIKFKDPGLLAQLKATRTAELIEGNTWNDTFWGVCKGKGQNHLGKLLMKIRDEQ